ncbi:hypothetical protein B0H98_109106 [Vreelandella songnenensis]|uniref:Uncharacterized protein n=1 Tax=Vreelandella songnenensis TaxID=1176243 RepID=A0A2T0UYW1_9GAMM|nr:hypothetical protein [Halomonas songnenensis]PRY63101.1 hypothetical protein B0H98_109106 [Halomonas songnenensis]
MTPEVARRHYLDAMGITGWVARYQLPNARPTEACEWDETPQAAPPPRERLQALLDDAPAPRAEPARPRQAEPPPASASPSAVRALLGQPAPEVPATQEAEKPVEPAARPSPATPARPLHFTLSCVCIGNRWLSLHPGELTPQAQRLLGNLLLAAGIEQDVTEVTQFKWPPMANTFAVEEPLEEAREGLSAFIAGSASRKQWALERVLWWGGAESESVADTLRVLNVQDAQSQTLALPLWQGPALEHLLQSGEAKRALWPMLSALAQAWQARAKQDAPHGD